MIDDLEVFVDVGGKDLLNYGMTTFGKLVRV